MAAGGQTDFSWGGETDDAALTLININFRFLVDGLEVEHRRVAIAFWDPTTGNVEIEPTRFRDFAATDADACWGMGYTVGTMAGESELCVVDRFVAPLLYVLADRVGEPNVASNVSLALGPFNRQACFDSIRTHCPQAFSQPVDGLVGLELFERLPGVPEAGP
jgi:hypothetical protein